MRRPHLPLVAALLAACTLPAVPAATAAGCAAIRSSGTWSVADPKPVHPRDIAVAFDAHGHDTLFGFAADTGTGREILRSTDGGCSWQVAVSLDSLGTGTDTMRLDPDYRILTVAVAQPTATRRAVVYALAGSDGAGWGVALPSTTLVSIDGGHEWTLHQPSQDDLTRDYPRCSRDLGAFTKLYVTTDPQSLYLRCLTAPLEVYDFAHCNHAFYVSHDGAKTWTAARGRNRDFTKATETGTGCGNEYLYPRPSQVTKDLVWDAILASDNKTGVLRVSHDGGAVFADYGRTTVPVSIKGLPGFAIGESTKPGVTPVVALYDPIDVYMPGPGGPAKGLVKLPRPKPKAGTIVALSGARFLQERSGAWQLVVAYETQGPVAAICIAYDLAHRRWHELPAVPRRPDVEPAWRAQKDMKTIAVAGVRSFYFVTWDDILIRYAG